jgi:hypothetical protein
MRKLPSHVFAVLVTVALLSSGAQAKGDFTQFGRDIRVNPGEKTGDLTCFNCSIYVRGQAGGDATAFNGRIVVESGGSVGGDVTAFLGDVRAEPGSTIGGEVTVMGGSLRREQGAAVGGEVTSFENKSWVLLILLSPFLILAGIVALVVWLVRRSRSAVPAPA